MAIAAVEHQVLVRLLFQRGKGRNVGLGKVADVDVVANTRSVRGRIVVPEDGDGPALPAGCFGRDLDQVRGARRRLAGPPTRIGPGHVEIAQGAIVEAVGRRDILQHGFGHQLGAAVGVDRRLVRRFGDRGVARRPIDGRGGREDEMRHASPHRDIHQCAALHRVVEVVAERVGHRIRHDHRTGEVQNGPDPVFGDQSAHQGLIGDVSLGEGNIGRARPAKAGGEIVDHDDRPSGVEEGEHHVAPHITSAAGDQDRGGAFTMGHNAVPREVRRRRSLSDRRDGPELLLRSGPSPGRGRFP